MIEWRADLHTHTNCSDGADSPLELLRLAKAAHLQGLSITDHDTIQAYTPELLAEAGNLGIELLIGTEVSTEFEGLTIHILAYGFERSLEQFLSQVVERRDERNRRILANLAKKKIYVEEKDLRISGPGQIVGRPHIAYAMMKKGYVASIQEAFNRYLADNAPCFATGGKFEPREAIDAIHQAGGKAILAHPHFLKRGHLLRELLSLPLDGLECYYGTLHKEREKPWLDMARERQWIATGGSDYHGINRSGVPLGASWVGEATFRKLSQS